MEIKRLNGYDIKDETARNSIQQLNQDVTQIKNNIQDINEEITEIESINKLVFMPIADESDYTYSVGDCSLLISKTGKTMLIDTGNEHSYSLIRSKLRELNITKLDYILITHYHGDHCSNLAYLAEDFDLTNTIYYLPKDNIIATDENATMKTLVNGIAADNTKIYPNSGDTLIIDDITITFCNCDDDDITYYNSQNTSANNFSICCYIETTNFSCFMSGDIDLIATERLYNQGLIKKVDIAKAEHHGNQVQAYSNYNLTLSPDYVIVSNTESNELYNFKTSPSTMLKNSLGAKVYCCNTEGCEIIFNSDEYQVQDKKQFNTSHRAMNDNRMNGKIYVNSTSEYTGTPDGTEEKPFKTIVSALGKAKTINDIQVEIYVNDNYESTERLFIENYNNCLRFHGNFTVETINVFNSNVVFLSTITIKGAYDRACLIDKSTVHFSNLIINGDMTSVETVTEGRGLSITQSNVYIEGILTISNKKIALTVYNCSNVKITSINGENNENMYICLGSSLLYFGGITYTMATNTEYASIYTSNNPKSDFVQIAISQMQQIPEGGDLNNYTVPGKYKSRNGTITTSLVNKPSGIGYAFWLDVTTGTNASNTIQKITSENLNHTSTGIWQRIYDYQNTQWSPWIRLATGSAS